MLMGLANTAQSDNTLCSTQSYIGHILIVSSWPKLPTHYWKVSGDRHYGALPLFLYLLFLLYMTSVFLIY